MLIDLLFLAIIVVTVFICYKKGFAVSLFNASSALISIILVYTLKNPVSNFLKNSFIGKGAYKKIYEIVEARYMTGADKFADANNIPGIFSDLLTSNTKISNSIVTYMTDRIFELGILVVTFLIVIIIIKLVTKFSPKIIRIFTRIPVIKQLDKGLGIAFGLVYGVIWSTIIVYAINVLSIYIDSEFLNSQVVASFVSELLNKLI